MLFLKKRLGHLKDHGFQFKFIDLGLKMQSDEVVWQIINHGHCSFKFKENKVATFCRNTYNVTGICNRSSCPLANSNYSTILEQNGALFLCLKSVERSHTPADMWQLIQLHDNYEAAFHQVSTALEHWPKFLVHKNKQRLTKITQYLIRTRKSAKSSRGRFVSVPKREKKKQQRMEGKAESSARLDSSIEQELLKRLKSGLYNNIYSFPSTQYEEEIDDHKKKHIIDLQPKIKERKEHIELEYE